MLDQRNTKQLLGMLPVPLKKIQPTVNLLFPRLCLDTSFNHEEQDDERLPLDEETLNNIIEDATQLLLEGLAEGGSIMRIKRLHIGDFGILQNQTLDDLTPAW